MNIGSLLSLLANALLARLESIGGALAISFGTLLMGYAADERQIILDAKQFFLDTYHAKKDAGADDLNAIEEAATAALNKFCHDEENEFHKILGGVMDLMAGALKRAAGV